LPGHTPIVPRNLEPNRNQEGPALTAFPNTWAAQPHGYEHLRLLRIFTPEMASEMLGYLIYDE